MVIIESAGITDVGRKRTGNEDALFLDSDTNLFIVADGMGGHQAGEVASNLVVDTMRDYMKRFKEDADAEEMEDFDETLSKEANRLLSSIHLANLGVNKVSHTKESYRGMGSTVSAVFFTDETLIAANVGDSPIYLVHNGTIERLSVLHTVMAEHAAIDPEGAANLGREYRHMLTRAMGIEETVEPDICEIPYFRDDVVVISSDGLSDKVSPDEILEIVNADRPEKACQRLVDLANERGGDDNVTVIVAKVKKTLHGKSGLSKLLSQILDGFLTPFKKIFK
ncbi:MAG: protein phosphatase 2C domain-containing protein [Thermodesulfobacteriota bacterium]